MLYYKNTKLKRKKKGGFSIYKYLKRNAKALIISKLIIGYSRI